MGKIENLKNPINFQPGCSVETCACFCQKLFQLLEHLRRFGDVWGNPHQQLRVAIILEVVII